MKVRRTGLALTAVAGLAFAPSAIAQKPPKPPKPGGAALSLDATPNPVTFTRPATLSGRLTGPTAKGIGVRLEQDVTAPLGDKFEPTRLTSTTANNGGYSFSVAPAVNTHYRVVAKTSPDTASPVRLVRVRPRVGLLLSDATPRARARVRFSGSVMPAHDGAAVSIQRRSPSGRWITVARTTLKDAGAVRSTYRRSLRVRRDGSYRVKLAGHADHINGFSTVRRVEVH